MKLRVSLWRMHYFILMLSPLWQMIPEFPQLFQQTSALVLNLGHLSQEREQSLLAASDYARQVNKLTVVDLVGYGASDIRNEVGEKLVHNQPTVVKGNLSEMRTFASW